MMPPLETWEYFIAPGGAGLNFLNKMGEEGWELVLLSTREGYPDKCILKRKLPPGPPLEEGLLGEE